MRVGLFLLLAFMIFFFSRLRQEQPNPPLSFMAKQTAKQSHLQERKHVRDPREKTRFQAPRQGFCSMSSRDLEPENRINSKCLRGAWGHLEPCQSLSHAHC